MDEKLSSINLYDKSNAAVLSLVTSEIPRLKEVRKKNGYDTEKPTFEIPYPLPYKNVTIDGVNIRYATSFQDTNKPTLVLLSAFPHSIMAYAPIWKILEKKYNLWAYDLPGFGRSEMGFQFMTFKYQGEFLKKFLENFDIKDAHLIGPDIGMPAILYYAGTYGENIKSIVVGDGPGISPSSNASVIRKMVGSSFWRLIFKVAGSGALVEAGKDICYVNYVPNKYEMSDYKKSYDGKVAQTLQWFKDYPSNIGQVDPLIEKIDLPTLIFWGDEDAILYPDNGERLHKRMKNSELKIIENCGHFAYQDRYKEFAEMLINWIDKE